MFNNSQIKLGIVLSYLNFFINASIGLLYIPYLIRILPENEYGLYLMMYSFMSMVLVLDFGMTGTIIRYYSKFDWERKNNEKNLVIKISKRIYNILSICILIIGIPLYVKFDSLYGTALKPEELFEGRIILAIILIHAIVVLQSNVYIAVIQAREKFVFQKTMLLLKTIGVPIVAIALSFYFRKAIVIFVTHLGCSIILYLCYKVYVKRRFIIQRVDQWNGLLFKEILFFAFLLFLNMVVDELYWSSGAMILGAIGGTKVVAVYGTANLIVTQFRSFSSVIHGIFLPKLTQMVACGNSEGVFALFLTVSKIQFFIVFLLYSGFLVYGKEFITFWAGSQYLESYKFALILMTSLLVPSIQSIAISILRAYNKQKFRAILYIILAVCNVVLSIPAAYYFQGYGCVIVTSVFLLIGNTIVMNIYYQKIIHLDMQNWWIQFGKMLIPVAVVALIGIVFKKVVQVDSILSLIVSIVVYLILYSCTMYSVGCSGQDKIQIHDMLKG